MDHAGRTAADLRTLNVIAVVGILDFALLVPLVLGLPVIGVLDTEAYVGVLGGTHGVGFLLLVALTGLGAARRRWGWWFPAITVLSGGPVGSLIGDVVVRRRIRSRASSASGAPGGGAPVDGA